jgi:RNA polymerase sigma-70 factor (ECF subfamily)
VQEVFLAVHQSIDRWREMAGAPFRPWLLRVAFNLTTSELRRRSRQAVATGTSDWHKRLTEMSEADSLASTERAWREWAFIWASQQVQSAVSPATWSAFWLTAIEQVPPVEAACRLGTTVGAVYAAKCRVLARIRVLAATLDGEVPAGAPTTDGLDGTGKDNGK